MAKKNAIRSSKKVSKSSAKLTRKLLGDETAEPEIPPNNNSVKRRKKECRNSDANVGNGVDEQPKYCHQCRTKKCRNDRDRVVECKKCRKKFCVSCMTKWYPNASEEEFVEACSVCRNNCNCKACLRGFSPKDIVTRKRVPRDNLLRYSCSKPNKIRYSKHILEKTLPLVRFLNEEQLTEKEIEAKVKGLYLSGIELQDAECEVDEDIFCDNCGAYFCDLYRSCALCGYDLCLACCRDLRDGHLQGGKDVTCGWKSCEDGSIPCPPKDIGGCSKGILELRRIMPVDWVVNLLKKAQGIKEINKSNDISQTSIKCCTCYDSGKSKEALQENVSTSFLYSLSAKDILQGHDMQHFQWHWSKGEPVIVSDVLSTSLGLSWEPMVLWRAFRDIKENDNRSQAYEVNAINCLDWSEVTVDLRQFFVGYLKGGFDREGWPRILKLEEWRPSCLSQKQLPRHFVEFISCLPFKDYTHPHNGYLNVAVKLPDLSLKPDMGPRMDIAYGVGQELEHVDSVTKLHYDKADTATVLTHTKSATITSTEHGDLTEGGALWDIFRRQDVSKLEEYLRNHSAEFMHAGCLSVEQIVHPIHDRTFYLNIEHKRKLKEEFGIEPWTFTQKLGDAVFIPACCPYQVRNIKSNTKVELNFVSPESLGECIRLQQEFRMLPHNHRAKHQKLNIGKMMLYALDDAVADLTGVVDSNESIDDLQVADVPNSSTDDDATVNIPCNNTNSWLCDTESDHNSKEKSSDGLSPDHEPTSVEASGTSDHQETVGLWRGHSVGLAAKELLQAVDRHYPTTFQAVHARSKAIWLPILKEFHELIKHFLETPVASLAEDRLTSLKEDLNEFERLGFDLSWAHQRLKMVENLKFGPDLSLQELMDLEECSKPLKKTLIKRAKEFLEAREMFGKARLEYDRAEDARNNKAKECLEAHEMFGKARLKYDRAEDARNNKAREVVNKFGADYDRVLNGHLGFGILPGY